MDRKAMMVLVLIFLLVLLGSSLALADMLPYFGKIVSTVTIVT